MNIFYNKKTLLDTLVGISNYDLDLVQKNVDGNILYFDRKSQQLKGFNILNVSRQLELNNGRQLITDQLRKFINEKCLYNFEDSSGEFIVGKILECEKIEGTHLSKCLIDIGERGHLKIVCGGINARTDLMVVVAMVGTIMPSGLLIEESMLRGNLSQGMLCSASELDLNGFKPDKGIIELDNTYEVGKLFLPAYSK